MGDRVIGPQGEWRVAWVTEGLAHTIIGLVDENGSPTVVSHGDWVTLVHEADSICTADEAQ